MHVQDGVGPTRRTAIFSAQDDTQDERADSERGKYTAMLGAEGRIWAAGK